MSFDVPADAYLSFMGRWSVPLAGVFLDGADVGAIGQVLDVGCGPGALAADLVRLLGASAVSAVDPSAPFVAAIRERYPEVAVEQASTFGWERYVGSSGHVVGMTTFGASAPLKALQEKFGFEPDQVAAAARPLLGKP